MTDTYICATDEAVLAAFCAGFKNVIGPARGRAESVDEEGNKFPARGDPAKFYACVRCEEALTLPKGIEACEDKTGVVVCGVWA